VRGISLPRVADASTMPTLASANSHATVFAIAERAAALIADRDQTSGQEPTVRTPFS